MTKYDLTTSEYGEYYQRYIDKVADKTILNEGYSGEGILKNYFSNIPESKLSYAYAEGKWTVKEVYQHMIDTERVFAHRMFRIGRMDSTPLPGFDQDVYISPSGANDKSLEQLNEEYISTRANTNSIINSLGSDQLSNIGTASGYPLSPRAAAFIILGHEIWHKEIIDDRYL